jgi:uncharacterized protein YebE (UPF0316 family)
MGGIVMSKLSIGTSVHHVIKVEVTPRKNNNIGDNFYQVSDIIIHGEDGDTTTVTVFGSNGRIIDVEA